MASFFCLSDIFSTTANPRPPMAGVIIFSDLDGTLLDHHSYAFAGAAGALNHIQRLGIPLILTTSKTRAEITTLQRTLGLDEPFIAENGGGLFFPARYDFLALPGAEVSGPYRQLRFGATYSDVRRFFNSVRHRFSLRGFGDMDRTEIVARTGLTTIEADLARQRDFSEPFVFLGEEQPAALAASAASAGLTITRGGRFFHLMGAGQDKGRAIRATLDIFNANGATNLRSIGLGDSANDLPMLAAVDIPVLIPHSDGKFVPVDLPGLRRAAAPGSRGWGEIVGELLNEISDA